MRRRAFTRNSSLRVGAGDITKQVRLRSVALEIRITLASVAIEPKSLVNVAVFGYQFNGRGSAFRILYGCADHLGGELASIRRQYFGAGNHPAAVGRAAGYNVKNIAL